MAGAMMQIAMMGKKPTVVEGNGEGPSGEDSAYLPASILLDNPSGACSMTFRSGVNPDSSYSTVDNTGTNTVTWKTGPNAASAYEVRITVDVGGIYMEGSALETWITLGAADSPSWSLTNGISHTADGTIEIRNASNPGVILATATFGWVSDPNA